MEYLNEIIRKAAEKVGGIQALEDHLGLPRKTLSMVGKSRGLPDYAQDKLEELMELEGGTLRAASAIITEKKPERVAYWKKKLMEFEKLAACILVGVILNMSPTPSQAAQSLQVIDLTLYIMSNKANAAQASENLMGTYPLALPIQKICHRPLQILLPTLLTKS